MKIKLLSDLHLEFGNPFKPDHSPDDAETVLVLAGDISTGSSTIEWVKDYLKDQFRAIVYILGNHEFYGNDINALPKEVLRKSFNIDGLHFLNNRAVVIDGVRFVGTTLWTDFNRKDPITMMKARQCMNDYGFILDKIEKVTPERIYEEHQKSLEFLVNKLEEPFEGETVVVTHHGPTSLSIHERYKTSPLNPYFVSDLAQIVEFYKAKYWLHGHTHETIDYTVGQTRVLTNPYGYHNSEVNPNFNPNLVLEIENKGFF